MDVGNAKRAFRAWCEQNGYVIDRYRKKGKKIDVVLRGYVADMDDSERESIAEGVIIGTHAAFGVRNLRPDVRIVTDDRIPKPPTPTRTSGGLAERGLAGTHR